MLKIHTACVGNHDLDFGVDHLEYLMGSTRFPWLLSNIFDAYAAERPLAGANLYRLFEWQGHRVGVIGLVEEVGNRLQRRIHRSEDRIFDLVICTASALSSDVICNFIGYL